MKLVTIQNRKFIVEDSYLQEFLKDNLQDFSETEQYYIKNEIKDINLNCGYEEI